MVKVEFDTQIGRINSTILEDWGEANLEWRANGHAVLRDALGGVLERIHVLECCLRVPPPMGAAGRAGVRAGRPAAERAAWLLGGLEFTFSTGLVRVVNALDENGLEGAPELGPDVRRRPL